MVAPKPVHQRRFVEREYKETELRKAFNIPSDEAIILSELIKYDPVRSTITVRTLKDFDEKQGDF